MSAEILLRNLRIIQKLLSQKYKSHDIKSCNQLTELLIVLAAAEQQFIDLYGDAPYPLLKVLNEAQEMCDPNKIKRHISKTIAYYI
jgi:hypothetical protein